MFARSGLITADVTVTERGVLVTAPLTFDGDVIVEEGSFLMDTQDVDEALGEVYIKHYDAWSLLKSPARAAAIDRSSIPLMKTLFTCPALLATQ